MREENLIVSVWRGDGEQGSSPLVLGQVVTFDVAGY